MTPNAPQLIVLQLVLGFSLQVCAVAQTTPREQLDRSAGFQTDAQLNKIREDNEEAQVREERRALDLRQRELLTRELLTKARAARTPPAEIEEKIVALRVMEAQLKEELGDNHPKLQALRHKIEVTEKWLSQTVAQEHDGKSRDRQQEHEGNHFLKMLQMKTEMVEIRKTLRETEDDQEREDLQEKLKELGHEMAELQEESARNHKEHEHGDHEHPQLKKVHALREAAQRLEASGVEDFARELHHRAEELEREMHRPQEGPEAVIHEMLQNIDQLRHEVRQMHEKLDHILDLLKDGDRRHRHKEDEDEDESAGIIQFTPRAAQLVWWDEDRYRAFRQQREQLAQNGPLRFRHIEINR
jgi:hypothetical protein